MMLTEMPTMAPSEMGVLALSRMPEMAEFTVTGKAEKGRRGEPKGVRRRGDGNAGVSSAPRAARPAPSSALRNPLHTSIS